MSIGDNSWVGDNVDLYILGNITIRNNAVASQMSYLCTGCHDYQSTIFDIYSKEIVIEDEVWVTTDVLLLL